MDFTEETATARYGVEAPFRHARFDIVLQPAELAGDG
jgi:hypothetical protein